MFIDIKGSIITTSEGQTFRKSDIYRVDLDISQINSRLFIEVELDKVPEQKLFYEKDYDFSRKAFWRFKPENPDLTFTAN